MRIVEKKINFKTKGDMKKTFLTLAAVATMLAACNNDDGIPTTDAMTDTPIALSVGVAEATARAGYAAGELTTGTLGFCMQTAGTEAMEQTVKEKYNGTNRKVDYVSGKWQIDGYPLLWRNATAEVSWQAYYPYSESNVTDGIRTVTIPTDQANDGVYDLLYGKGTTDCMTSSSGIDVGLKHTMAKFIVNITVGTELEGAEIESVVLTGMATRNKFNVSNPDININIGYFMDELELLANINMIKHEDGKTFEAIVLPYTPSEIGLEIILTGGEKFYYKQGLPKFEKGMIHTLNLRVGKDKVELAESGITVGAWEEGNEGNDDFRTE